MTRFRIEREISLRNAFCKAPKGRVPRNICRTLFSHTRLRKSRSQRRRFAASPAVILAIVVSAGVSAGCQRPAEPFTRVAVEGEVTWQGQPLDGAKIRFVPLGETTGPKTVFPIQAGRFAATSDSGPPAGNHRVEIELVDDPRWSHDDEQAWTRLASSRGRIDRPTLPNAYHVNSRLTATVTAPTADRSEPLKLSFVLTERP